MRRVFLAFSVALLASALLSSAASGETLHVALIADPGGAREATTAAEYFDRVERALTGAGVRCSTLTGGQLVAGALLDHRIAVVPYAPNLSSEARLALRSFCSDGGKVMCFYSTYGLDAELGLVSARYVASPQRTLFCHVKCLQDAVPGLPQGFDQVSWNIRSATPRSGTLVLAKWLDKNGQESGHIAATLSHGGFFFSHVLLAEGKENERAAGLMLRAAAEQLARQTAPRSDIAIVYGTASERAGGSDSRLVKDMVRQMEQMLDEAAVPHAILTDEAVARGALTGRKVAILPLNFKITDEEAGALKDFARAGGKVIGFFSMDRRLLPLVGIATSRFRAGGPSTPFHVVKFSAAAPRSFPARFAQRSSNIMEVQTAPDGIVIATWHDSAGNDTGFPAVVLSPGGMYFSYILRADDISRTSQFMLAGIAHFAGEGVYESAARRVAAGLWDFRRYRDRQSLGAACHGDAKAAEAAADAVRLETRAHQEIAAGRFSTAYATLSDARKAAELAFIRSLPSRDEQEFRGAWIHSPDVPGSDWDALFAGMRRSRLNALLPNVCSGGYAHYTSDVLPLSQLIKERGPQMARMLAAAKRHGIQVHLWRVNYNLMRPEKPVLQRFIAQNRVCLDPQGKVVGGPNSATLCPSHPENQRLEIEAMLEMTRKFHPDGIHFDYIRYPNGQSCYCQGCRLRFERQTGRRLQNWPQDVLAGGALRQEFLDFRRDQITTVVREVSRRSRQIDPQVKISAAVFSNWDTWARDNVAQDWPMWIEKGYLDFVCPMDYTQNVGELAALVAKQRDWVAGRVPLYVGLGAWRSRSAWHTADLVDTARANGADGLVFFEYRGRVVTELIPALLEGPFRQDANSPYAESGTD